MTLIIKVLYVTLSINDTQHNNALHYSECNYAQCPVLFVVMLIVTIVNVVLLSVAAPFICLVSVTNNKSFKTLVSASP